MTDEEAPKIWVPQAAGLGANVADIAKAYSLLLEIRYLDHHRSFQLRTGSDPDAAKAEAVVFSCNGGRSFKSNSWTDRPERLSGGSAGAGETGCAGDPRAFYVPFFLSTPAPLRLLPGLPSQSPSPGPRVRIQSP